MGWFSRSAAPALRSADQIAALTGGERRDFNAGSQFWDTTVPPPWAGFDAGGSGVYVSERTAMQHLAVHSCVRLLADSIAALPVDVYRKTGAVRIGLGTPPVLEDPDPDINGFEFMQQIVASLALRGNSYELVTSRDKLEYPVTRIPVHPDAVKVSKSKVDGRPDFVINGAAVPRADVIQIRRLTLPGQVVGLSPLEQARQAIGLGLAAERYGARWFGDSADPSAVLETDANLPSDEATAVMRSWVASHGGRRHPAVLSGGLKYRPITITPNESQFLETRGFQRGEIAMFFGIPPHMIGDVDKSTSWGKGIEQQSIGFVQFSLMPWLRVIEAAYSRVLLPRGQYMRFNVSALLRGDLMTRYTAYTQARNAGWLNVDEIRALEDMPPVPDGSGESYIQPLNMGPLGSDPLAAANTTQMMGDPGA